jgi:hypothetical protein
MVNLVLTKLTFHVSVHSVYCYFPKVTAHAASFWERATKNYPNLLKIVEAIFKKITLFWGSSEGLFHLNLKTDSFHSYNTFSYIHMGIGIDWWSHLRKVPRKRQISHTHHVWLWGCSPCKISSPGPVFHGTKWLLWCPPIQSPTLHSRCGINKGLIKRGSNNISLKVAVQGLNFMAHPSTYVHTTCIWGTR